MWVSEWCSPLRISGVTFFSSPIFRWIAFPVASQLSTADSCLLLRWKHRCFCLSCSLDTFFSRGAEAVTYHGNLTPAPRHTCFRIAQRALDVEPPVHSCLSLTEMGLRWNRWSPVGFQPICTHRIRYKNWVAVISAKNQKRQRRKRQSVTAKREKSQTPKVLTAIRTSPNLT